jgi:deazaflavin-dependent oxidoreductase (nitroreductase family)
MKPTTHAEAGRVRQFVRWYSATAPMAWIFARTQHHIDAWTFRLTKGRQTSSTALSGIPVVMLTTIGAKSGRRRTMPVVGLPDGDDLVVIASNFGQARHPAWYHNLRADPAATVVADGVSRAMRAREVHGAERERLWQLAVEIHPGWILYERRATAAQRRIPVLVLSPVTESAATVTSTSTS